MLLLGLPYNRVYGVSYNPLVFAPFAIAELVTLMFTLWKIVQEYSMEHENGFNISPLVQLVIRDNILYFVV